ncbi:calcium-independent phospholipase A2-gamma-like [Asterias rubens]|uniref:calcium-independent phospholipase A2-gamma-like n=1 Tax=Asterias rubens TaxID=7604 RepID=UPI00145540AC|nr:calcium-independent phospholipase A2-gamma-like [Asterias rubens]XP_033647868.1 calcium-independent phospholipase A2-gamma-like [Asterias rubens]
MSLNCCRVAVAAQLSLHGGGIITCRCTQLRARGPTLNPAKGPSGNRSLSSSSSSSKTTEPEDLTVKKAKQKSALSFQDRVKYLRESVTTASTRVQDSLHSSREAFLESMHALQTSSDGKEVKSKFTVKSDRKEVLSDETFDSDGHESSTASDHNNNSVDSKVESLNPNCGSNEDLPKGIEKSSTEGEVASSQARKPEVSYTQPDFWINIPSLQDRLNRMKVPFRRTAPQNSTSEPASDNLQEGHQDDGVVHLEPMLKVDHPHHSNRKPRDADAFKPESFEVTAEVQSDGHESDQKTDEGSRGHSKKPSLKAASPNVMKSFPGMVSSNDSEDKKSGADTNTSLKESRETYEFDFETSPILEMNVALLEPREMQQGGVTRKVLAARETREEAQRRKEKIEAEEVAAKKATRKPMKPVISKASIDDRTKNLAIGIRCAGSNSSRLLKLEKLAAHLTLYPESREVAVKERLIPSLLKIQNSWDKALTEQVHETLALLGYAPPVKGRGIRILSVDGGGTRGVIAIEALREIERRTNKPIRELFDYMIGVSSGAVLCFLLAFDGATLDECEELYRELSQDVFKRNTLLGTSKLFLNHAFYDTEGWIKILRTHSLGDIPMMSTARDATCPKVAAVAAMMNIGCIKDFLFRNYNLPSGVQSHYRGSCKYELWQAARASSAAPGYFEEFKLDDFVFQDGGVLTNNPSALAVHECRLLWPDTPIQCVVSMGCGRYDPSDDIAEPEYSSLKKKLTNIMMSATDTESVHTVLQDLLPSGAYFRFNPSITEDFLLDENRTEKIAQMQEEARDYLELNELKMEQVSGVLSREKTRLQKLLDWVQVQREVRRR